MHQVKCECVSAWIEVTVNKVLQSTNSRQLQWQSQVVHRQRQQQSQQQQQKRSRDIAINKCQPVQTVVVWRKGWFKGFSKCKVKKKSRVGVVYSLSVDLNFFPSNENQFALFVICFWAQQFQKVDCVCVCVCAKEWETPWATDDLRDDLTLRCDHYFEFTLVGIYL